MVGVRGSLERGLLVSSKAVKASDDMSDHSPLQRPCRCRPVSGQLYPDDGRSSAPPGTPRSPHSRQHQRVLREATGPGVLFIMEHGQCPQDSGQATPRDEHCRQNPGWGQCGVRGPQPLPTPVTAGSSLLIRTFTQHAEGQARTGARGLGGTGPGALGRMGSCSASGPDGFLRWSQHDSPRGPAGGSGHSTQDQLTPSPTLSHNAAQHTHTSSPTSQNAHSNNSLQTYCGLCLQALGPSPFQPSMCCTPAQVTTSRKPSLMSRPSCPRSLTRLRATPAQRSPGPLPADSMSQKHASKALGRKSVVF